MSILLPPPGSPLRRLAGAVLRSPAGTALEALAAPHGLDRYLELVHPLLVRDAVRAVVTDVRRETRETTTLTLRPNRWTGHRAGQYVQVAVEIDGRRLVRCYSISSSEHRDDGQLTITVKTDPQGRVSPFLARHARPGLVVGLSPAAGGFTLPPARPERLLLVSAGSGITPVMSILRSLVHERATTRITFLHYARSRTEMAFAEELRQLDARQENVELVTVLTREPAASDRGLSGHLSAAHLDAVADMTTPPQTYVCGPDALVTAATDMAVEGGWQDRLHVERFQPVTDRGPDPAVGGRISFARTDTTVGNDGGTLLEQAEGAGLSPQSGCRVGICHTCIKPKLTGRVRDARDGRVSSCGPEDVQLCVSVPVGDVTIDL